MTERCAVVDLFCGIGGLTHGFVLEKFNVVAGIDADESCRYAFEKNNRANFYAEDLDTLSSDFVDSLFGGVETRILVGCAPCQAFSTYSRKYKHNDKWKMLYAFGRTIGEIRPEIISMENVANLKDYNQGRVFKDFLAVLDKNNYSVNWEIVDSSLYGVPQHRKRLILFASRFGRIDLLEPTCSDKRVTVSEAIGGLPPIEDGETHPEDLLHRSRKLSPINKKRIRATPYGGGWKDWPEELLLECHKKKTGKSFGSVYGRMVWGDVAPTVTTQCIGLGNGRFGHPEQDRAISLREAALFQTFPTDYAFFDPKTRLSESRLSRHIGNAVPVNLGRIIARSIKRHLNKYNR